MQILNKHLIPTHIILTLVIILLTAAPLTSAAHNYKRVINCTGITSELPVIINGTAGVTLNGTKQIIWTNCKANLTLYYNDSTAYAVYENTTEPVPFEVEAGNGTSNNASGVWTSATFPYAYVFHFTPNITNSVTGLNGSVLGESNFTNGYLGYMATTAAKTILIPYPADITTIHANEYTMLGVVNAVDSSDYVGLFGYGSGTSGSSVWSYMGFNSAGAGRKLDYQFNYNQGAVKEAGSNLYGAWNVLTETKSTDASSSIVAYMNKTQLGTENYGGSWTSRTLPLGNFTGNIWVSAGIINYTGSLTEFRIADRQISFTEQNQTNDNIKGAAGFGNILSEENETSGATATINFNANTTAEATYFNNTKNNIYASLKVENLENTNTTIKLYLDGASYSTITSASNYSYNFTGLPNGYYILNATATDGSTQINSTNKNYIIYGLNTNISTPTNNESINRYINITITANSTPAVSTSSLMNLTLLNNDLSLNRSIAGNITNTTSISNATEVNYTLHDIWVGAKNFTINSYVFNVTNEIKSGNAGTNATARILYYYNDTTTARSPSLTMQGTSYTAKSYTNPYPNKYVTSITIELYGNTPSYQQYERNTTINKRQIGSLTLNPAAGNITGTIDLTPYNLYPNTYYLKLEITDNNSNSISTTRLFYLATDSQLDISALAYADNSTISNFTTNLTDKTTGITTSANSVDNTTSFYIIRGRNYTSIIDSQGYAYDNSTINTNTNDTNYMNYTAYLFTNNSVSINIYDSNNLTLMNGVNVTIKFIGDTTISVTTQNGTHYQDGLKDGTWSIKFTAANYSIKYYSISVANKSHQTLNAYLVSGAYSTIFTIQDSSNTNPIENATFVAEILNGSTYVVTDTLQSDISGKVQMYYIAGEKYKFTISATDYTTKIFYLNPILFSAYIINLDRSIAPESGLDYADIEITYYPKTFYNNQTQDFSYLISSPTGRLLGYTINLTYPNSANGSSGNNANGGSFVLNLNITGAMRNDRVNVTYTYNTTTGGFRSFTYSYEILNTGESNQTIAHLRTQDYGLGLFEKSLVVMIILIIVVGFGFLLGGMAAALTLGLALMGFAVYLGFLPVWSIIISVIIGLAIIVKSSSNGGV